MLGVLSVSGVIGTWAGPRSPGTAFVMAHHKVGDVGDGELGSWGFPRGGMGGLTHGDRDARRARSASRSASTRRSPASSSRDGRVAGVVLPSGEELRAPTVVTTVHPKIAFLDLVDRNDLPADFVARHRAVEHAQRHGEDQPRRRPAARVHRRSPASTPRCTAARSCSRRSLDEVEGAFQDAVGRARRATRPFADICIPSVFDRLARTRGPPHRVDVHAVGAPRVGRQADARRARRLRRPRRRDGRRGGAGLHRLDPAPAR